MQTKWKKTLLFLIATGLVSAALTYQSSRELKDLNKAKKSNLLSDKTRAENNFFSHKKFILLCSMIAGVFLIEGIKNLPFFPKVKKKTQQCWKTMQTKVKPTLKTYLK